MSRLLQVGIDPDDACLNSLINRRFHHFGSQP
jgi:hypothetical protein